MKNIKSFIACLTLMVGFASDAFCATNGVLLGQNFQSAINASASGDTLIVQSGVYPDTNIVFNIPLTVLPSGTNGNPIQFLGTIQVTSGGVNSFQRAYFGANVQTTNSVVSFFDSYFNSPVTATGGKVTMKRTILSANSLLMLTSNAALEALRMTNSATVVATATAGFGTPFLAVQCVFSNTVTVSGYKVWLGYDTFAIQTTNPVSNLRGTNCDSVLIGNNFLFTNGGATSPICIYFSGGTLKAYNNLIYANDPPGTGLTELNLDSTIAEIVNNTLSGGPNGFQALIQANGSSSVTMRGNIFKGGSFSSYPLIQATGAAGQALFISYSDLYTPWYAALLTGVTPPPVNCLLGVNPTLAVDYTLNAGSPCLNVGPPDAIYNNRDGTRNTMGYTGGPYWNPANYTNNNPMVFLLTGQQTVLSGIQTNIQVNIGASAGH